MPCSAICVTAVASLFNLCGCLSCPLCLALLVNNLTNDGQSSAANAESTTTIVVPSVQ